MTHTSISYLPTAGLNHLQKIILKNVPTLKVFPPVLRLSKIKHADLTYSQHCCAFAHPELQYRKEYEDYMKNENVPKCTTTVAQSTTPGMPTTTTAKSMSGGEGDDDGGWSDHDGGNPGGWGTNNGGWGQPGHIPTPGTMSDMTRKRSVPQWLLSSLYHVRHRRRTYIHGLDEMFNSHHSCIAKRHAAAWSGWAESQHKNNEKNNGFGQMKEGMPSGGGKWHTSTLNPNETVTKIVSCGDIVADLRNAECTPKPDAFNPCEDVMGSLALRVVVWFVVTAAILGNFAVLVVTLASRTMSVSKFLIANLAFADLCLGLYLLLLACIDLHSKGIYFSYAMLWQYGGGCHAAGFLAIYSTSLSVFTLTVITMERWYAITHAIHLTKRLSLKQASVIMICGWTYSIIMGMLPLVGVSSYEHTSICLPMKTVRSFDRGYVFMLPILNSGAFAIIFWCYVDMYCKVRGNSSAIGKNDANIAKRMAVLVFTDFACLFPIAFFGLTAAAGKPLITVSHSKILLVFFFPLNSCANPFLYAIVTKQFRKDLFSLLNRHGLCERRGQKYRSTYNTSNHPSLSHSRNNSICHNQVRNVSNGTILTTFFTDYKLSVSKHSPGHTPETTPRSSKKSSPKVSPCPCPHSASFGNTSDKLKTNASKLSMVRESSNSFDAGEEIPLRERKQGVSDLHPKEEQSCLVEGHDSDTEDPSSGYTRLYCGKTVGVFDSIERPFAKAFKDRKDSAKTQASCMTEMSMLSDVDSPSLLDAASPRSDLSFSPRIDEEPSSTADYFSTDTTSDNL